MSAFTGFPAGKTRFTPIPDLFFSELLTEIDDLAELKLTLFMFWFLHNQRGHPCFMTMTELRGERVLLQALAHASAPQTETQCADPDISADPVHILECAVDRAVARGTLLRVRVADEGGATSDYLFANTALGRKAVAAVKRGELILDRPGYVREWTQQPERPNIFALYEQNVGLLQPLIAEELREAEDSYPEEWIADAFRLAAGNNVRRWRYVRSILERWAREGKDDGTSAPGRRHDRRPAGRDRR